MKHSMPDVKQPGPGDLVCILVGDMNPPTADIRHAADCILARPEISGLWVCPMWTGDTKQVDVRNMGTTFCAEYSASSGKLVTFCSVAIDKKMSNANDVISWARSKYTDLKFRLASSVPCQDSEPAYLIRFFGQQDAPVGSIPISLDKFHSMSTGIRERIATGRDESRNFFPGVWEYIQKNKLYR